MSTHTFLAGIVAVLSTMLTADVLEGASAGEPMRRAPVSGAASRRMAESCILRRGGVGRTKG
eukprot:CAMPEP_0195648394 /NCGR_PEP_ID=MMETSP0815-20121206/30621_1 /TAXON_ID=97485 /ORGANISM="Prymnesium parvum, Strain Texoma1" /LENGTH=61 /DNA_ID=CAMNT_0040792051 /DNA_START=9 /DNA_END=190 /DNA_ORIENTATION=+